MNFLKHLSKVRLSHFVSGMGFEVRYIKKRLEGKNTQNDKL